MVVYLITKRFAKLETGVESLPTFIAHKRVVSRR